jgi:glutathione S-transferase
MREQDSAGILAAMLPPRSATTPPSRLDRAARSARARDSGAALARAEPLALFESGAILEYLADKTGQFLPRAGAERYAVLQWVHWQMANLGPMMGNANHFKNYAKHLVDDAHQLAYGTKRFVGEVDRLCGVLDAQLAARRHLAGEAYSIADIITWPWASLLGRLIDESVWDRVPPTGAPATMRLHRTVQSAVR